MLEGVSQIEVGFLCILLTILELALLEGSWAWSWQLVSRALEGSWG